MKPTGNIPAKFYHHSRPIAGPFQHRSNLAMLSNTLVFLHTSSRKNVKEVLTLFLTSKVSPTLVSTQHSNKQPFDTEKI